MSKNENEGESPEKYTVKDGMLISLINTVDNSGWTIAVTLYSHGFIISGSLISKKHYLGQFGKQLDTGFKSDEKIFESELNTLAEDLSNQKNYYFIHMMETKIFDASGNSIPSSGDGLLWRGRVSEISGFNLGALEIS